MSKRSFLFGTLALLAGLASATPSHAGSVIATTVGFTTATPGLTEIIVTYTGAGTLTPITQTVTDGTVTVSGNVATLTFTSANTGPYGPITFDLADSSTATVTGSPSFNPPGSSLTGFDFKITQSAVPEPASIALLGIGMAGFLAYRRFFKKTSVA